MSVNSNVVTSILNGTTSSVRNVIPIKIDFHQPLKSHQTLQLNFGVLIGITGDVKGKMVLTGEDSVFGIIGEKMFGMVVEGEMLTSFSGELGNMIAGGLSTKIVEEGLRTDITSPTLIQGNTTLSGYRNAIQVPFSLEEVGNMDIYLLLD